MKGVIIKKKKTGPKTFFIIIKGDDGVDYYADGHRFLKPLRLQHFWVGNKAVFDSEITVVQQGKYPFANRVVPAMAVDPNTSERHERRLQNEDRHRQKEERKRQYDKRMAQAAMKRRYEADYTRYAIQSWTGEKWVPVIRNGAPVFCTDKEKSTHEIRRLQNDNPGVRYRFKATTAMAVTVCNGKVQSAVYNK